MPQSLNEEYFHNHSAFANADEDGAEPIQVDDGETVSDYDTGIEMLDEHAADDDGIEIFNESDAKDPLDFVVFENAKSVHVKQFGVTAISYPFSFRDQRNIQDGEKVARAAFGHILNHALQEAADGDLVGASINHPALDHEILINFSSRENTTVDRIMKTIESVQQSKKELDFDSTMEMHVVKVSPPEGRGYKDLYKGSFEEFFKYHSGGHGSTIIEIKNKDWMCLARAVVTAKSHYQHYVLGDKSVQWDSIKRGDERKYTKQKRLALELMTKAGLLGLQKQSCGIPEIRKIQKVVQKEGFQLKVFSYENYNALIFDEQITGLPYLYLYFHHNHYDVLKSPKIFTGSNTFCDQCNKGYDRLEEHKCSVRCPCCKSHGKCLENGRITCQICKRRFLSKTCFENHLKRPESYKVMKNRKRVKVLGESICMKLKKCLECGRCVARCRLPAPKHNCGMSYCSVCKLYYKTGKVHECFMQPIKEKTRCREAEPGEGEDDPDDLDALVREEEEEQGETEATRQQHFAKFKNDGAAKYLFWDFETTQVKHKNDSTSDSSGYKEKIITVDKKKYSLGPVYEHVPNYCVARKACMLCKGFWLSRCQDSQCKARGCEKCQAEKPNCNVCTEHKAIFSGEDCKEQFCEYLFQSQHKGLTAIAHNARGFDAQFIIQWLMVTKKHIPQIVPRGRSILSLEALGVKIIDSHAFLPQSLASLPKTFNEPELKKGYFPYLFNTPENQNYVGQFPAPDQYCPSEMKPDARDRFYQWYHEHKGGVFDMQKEIREYTESDVDILLRCCLKFNDLFHQQTGVYPLEIAITIAQACNHIFRKHHLQPNTVGVIPTGGYRGRERQSLQALEWLRWIGHLKKCRVDHARNGKEKKISHFKADGFIEKTNTVLEYYGCVWHGCPKCYKNRDKKVPNSSLTYEKAYQKTLDRAEIIRNMGYDLIELWGCEWEEEKVEKPEIGDFLKQFDPFEVITGRDALYGGRTNATVLWKKCKKGEKISYYDVCSLYPYVCKYGAFPLGHPSVITEKFEPVTIDSKPYFGLIRCKVLPPRGLLHPVLPYKHKDRLNFPLCKTCLEEENQKKCSHSDQERSFVGTFVSLELNKAVDLRYKILDMYEVWHYDQKAQYNKQSEDQGLFASYINQFLKLKQEKSGWPSHAKTEEDKMRYIEDYEKREGIQLNPREVEKNPGIRAIAKLMLNSFWGKFAQKDDMASTDFYMQPNDFFDAVLNKETGIKAIRVMSDDMVAVTTKKNPLHQAPNPNTSVVLAAFVTAQARLKLYSYLENLRDRVLYFDTDSVIFVTRPGDQYMPPTGDYLGDLTNELDGYGAGCFISEFVSCGPKQYSFIVVDPKTGKRVGTVTKVKGFSLNYTNSAHINFQSMKEQVMAFVQSKEYKTVTIYQPQFKRSETHKVMSEILRKEQKLVYCKRAVQADYTSLPYGY